MRWTYLGIAVAALAALALAVIAALVLATPSRHGQQQPARAQQSSQALDRYLDRAWPDGAGGTVLTARGGGHVTCRGFGLADRAAHVAAGCDTVYDLMSMTKQFTAAAIVKLEMMGRLRTSDRIGRFLGRVPADKRSITLRQLLTHTSGLPEALGDDYDPLSRRQLIDRALAATPVSPPGRAFHYSNVGYSLLAAIVERVSATGYERFLAEQLFGPAGMTQTGYVLPRWKRERVAVEYDAHGRSMGRPFDHPWASDGPYWNLRGNGGMLSTARDMLRWHRALLGDAVLSARAKRELFAPRVPIPVQGYEGFSSAYGWAVSRSAADRIATHSGANGWSYGVVARFLDDGTLVFWISNRAAAAGRWNLQPKARELTLGIAARVRDG